jgi:hypothetical protein
MAEEAADLFFGEKGLGSLYFVGVVPVVYCSRGFRTSGCEAEGRERRGLLEDAGEVASREGPRYCSWQSSKGAPQYASG